MISLSHNWVWAGINKTATTSIQIGLQSKCETFLHKHHTLEDSWYWCQKKKYIKIDREYFNKMFKFCFVRNPWDRAVSMYKYRCQENLYNMRYGHTSFRDFVIKGLRNHEEPFTYPDVKYLKDQYSWMLLDGEMKMDFIGRFENIDEDWKKLCNLINIEYTELPRKNYTKHKNYREYYTTKTKNIISKVYSRDIETFNYTF